MDKIGVYLNEQLIQPKGLPVTLNSCDELKNVELYCSKEQIGCLPEGFKVPDIDTKLDCLLVFGGDGTILSAVDFSLQHKAPIVGINLGKLGFLTDFSFTDFKKYLPKLISGEYRIFERMLLHTSVIRKRRCIYEGVALNDAVVHKGLVSRLINLRLNCSNNLVLETRCDGMIAATPTGSTAYSLSAGGPILPPEMEAIIIAALCPHVLSVRPIVFPAEVTLSIKMAKVYNETMLQIDGKNVQSLNDGDIIYIRKAACKVQFISSTGRDFFETLRKKLHMGKI